MSEIASFIQEKIEAAQAEKARLEEYARLASERKAALLKADSLENTVKAFGYLGIEVAEEDLNYDEHNGYYLLHNNVQIALSKLNGINHIYERSSFPHQVTDMTLILSVAIPSKYINEDGELARGFYHNDLTKKFPIEIRVHAEPQIRDKDKLDIFTAIPELEQRFQMAIAQNERTSSKASSEVKNSPEDESFKEWTPSEINFMHCLQICQDAIRIINDLDATGEPSYGSEWLAKANAWLEAQEGQKQS